MQQHIRQNLQLAFGAAKDRRLAESVIARLPLFGQLSGATRNALAEHARLREARRGEVIAQRGAPMAGMFALVSGLAKLSLRAPRGREDVVRLLGPGESFGLAAALLERTCPVDLIALAPSMVLTLPPAPLQRLLERDAAFGRSAARALAERLLALLGDLETSLQRNSLQRLALYLDAHAGAESLSRAWQVRLPATKTTIAALLGVKKETLSRLLHELSRRGLIAVAGRDVSILERAALRRLAGLEP